MDMVLTVTALLTVLRLPRLLLRLHRLPSKQHLLPGKPDGGGSSESPPFFLPTRMYDCMDAGGRAMQEQLPRYIAARTTTGM
jgi:hypothetical protein